MRRKIMNRITASPAAIRIALLGGAALAAVGVSIAIESHLSAAPTTAMSAPASQPARRENPNPDAVLMMPATPLSERLVVSRPLGSDFVVLKHRSIFIHGQQTHGLDDESPHRETYAVVRPESMLVFNGVARVNDQLAAFFEDTSTHDVIVRRENDALAQGHITHITLDSVDYDANGHTTHIAIGQSLDGGYGGGSLANQPTGGFSNGSSSSSASSSSSSGAGSDSVLERLRRRRQQEMGK